ncbi:MAG: cytidylate kinase-like family protein [Bacteroidales bacterium]|nr:cytidylate kinase-like family protein [Bacteroidales bacterium]
MKLNEKFVITVSREVGSGGHTVGKKLAERLGVRFCDKNVIHRLMEQFNLSVYEIESIKSRKKSWIADLFDSIAPVSRNEPFLVSAPHAEALRVSADEIAGAEKEILKALAEESSCVIAGRAAFALLAEMPNKLDVFIRSSEQNRIDRVVRKQGLTPEQAKAVIDNIDEGRENYVQRICGRSRYDSRNYDLVINMDQMESEDAAVDVILKFFPGLSSD